MKDELKRKQLTELAIIKNVYKNGWFLFNFIWSILLVYYL